MQLATRTFKPKEDNEFQIMETQSDDEDYVNKTGWEDDEEIFEQFNVSRGSNTNSRFNLLQSKIISPYDRIMDDTLIRNSGDMVKATLSKSVFVPRPLWHSQSEQDIDIRNEILTKVTKFDGLFKFSLRNTVTNPINKVMNYNSRKRFYFRSKNMMQQSRASRKFY